MGNRKHNRGAGRVAGRTIDVYASRSLRSRRVTSVARCGGNQGFMFVIVMTEMRRGERAFVLAIGHRECPRRLEHNEEHKESVQQRTHSGNSLAAANWPDHANNPDIRWMARRGTAEVGGRRTYLPHGGSQTGGGVAQVVQRTVVGPRRRRHGWASTSRPWRDDKEVTGAVGHHYRLPRGVPRGE